MNIIFFSSKSNVNYVSAAYDMIKHKHMLLNWCCEELWKIAVCRSCNIIDFYTTLHDDLCFSVDFNSCRQYNS